MGASPRRNVNPRPDLLKCRLLCFTVGAQQAAFSQEGQSPDDLFKKLSASVFRVEGLDRDEGWELLGSAVAVRPNVLVTNWHIIEAGRQAGFSPLRVAQGEKTWPVELVVFDPSAGGTIRSDLCLLWIGLKYGSEPKAQREPKARPVKIRPSSALKVGEPVYLVIPCPRPGRIALDSPRIGL